MSSNAASEPKTALRWLFRDARRQFVAGLSAAERDRLHHDLARSTGPALAGFALPGSYAAVGDEIDPVIIEHGFAAIAFPRVNGSELEFRQSRWSELVPGYAGIPEPPLSAPQVAPDLLLIPVVAVTLSGVRLGQGKGFYDRALAALRKARPVRTIALAWDCQIADALPADPWDMPVDYVATPTRLVDCAALR
jgi:5-formyltetrahydrofolate cyclo-ligase